MYDINSTIQARDGITFYAPTGMFKLVFAFLLGRYMLYKKLLTHMSVVVHMCPSCNSVTKLYSLLHTH